MKSKQKMSGLIIALAFTCSLLNAQDKALYLILQKGKAVVVVGQPKQIAEFKPGKRETLPLNATLTLAPGSSAIVYNQNGTTEIGGVREENYQTTTLFNELNQKPKTDEFIRFYEFLNHTYAEMRKSETLQGSVTAAADRGLDTHEFFYSPDDSSFIISDSLELSWNPVGYFRLITNLVVVNTDTGDTVYNAQPVASCVSLYKLREGEYHWLGKIKMQNGKALKMDNIFYVPSGTKKNSMRNDLSQFKETISSFTYTTRTNLLHEYLFQNRIYCKGN